MLQFEYAKELSQAHSANIRAISGGYVSPPSHLCAHIGFGVPNILYLDYCLIPKTCGKESVDFRTECSTTSLQTGGSLSSSYPANFPAGHFLGQHWPNQITEYPPPLACCPVWIINTTVGMSSTFPSP